VLVSASGDFTSLATVSGPMEAGAALAVVQTVHVWSRSFFAFAALTFKIVTRRFVGRGWFGAGAPLL
jgi:hypothetical protein